MASRKSYPVRNRVRTNVAVNNILNWLENDNELAASDSEEEDSEYEGEEYDQSADEKTRN